MDLPSLPETLLPALSTRDLQNPLYQHHGILYKLASDQGTHINTEVVLMPVEFSDATVGPIIWRQLT